MTGPHHDDGGSTNDSLDGSRRQFLRRLGTGALACTGAASAGSTATAQDDGPTLDGIEDYSFGPVRDTVSGGPPSVEFGADAVVVEGSFTYEIRSMMEGLCPELALSHVYVNEATDRLGVVLDREDVVYEHGPCPGQHDYRLEVVPEGEVPDVVEVDERYRLGHQVVEHRDGPPVALPDGVDDYELTVGEPVESPALERDPAVTFGDGEIVVEGTHHVDASGCDTVDLVRVEYETESHLTVELDQRPEYFLPPGEECPEDRVPLPYELRLTLTDALPERFTVVDEHDLGQRTTIHRSGKPALPESVTDVEFVVDDHPSPDYLGTDPVGVVRVDADALVVEGTLESGVDEPDPGVTAVSETVLEDQSTDADTSGDDGDASVEREAVEVSIGDGGWADRTHLRFCPLESRCYHPYELRLAFDDGVPDAVRIAVDHGLASWTRDVDPATAGPPAVDGVEARPYGEDLLYRDFDGDGALGQNDVSRFFRYQHRDVVCDYPGYYDFSGNGDVTHGDVVELFDTVALG